MFWGNHFLVTTVYMFDFMHSFSYLVMHMHMFINNTYVYVDLVIHLIILYIHLGSVMW